MKKVKCLNKEDFEKLGEIIDNLYKSTKGICEAQEKFNENMKEFFNHMKNAEQIFMKQFIEDNNET